MPPKNDLQFSASARNSAQFTVLIRLRLRGIFKLLPWPAHDQNPITRTRVSHRNLMVVFNHNNGDITFEHRPGLRSR